MKKIIQGSDFCRKIKQKYSLVMRHPSKETKKGKSENNDKRTTANKIISNRLNEKKVKEIK